MQRRVLPALANPMPAEHGSGASLINPALIGRLAVFVGFLIAATVHAVAGGGQAALLLALAAAVWLNLATLFGAPVLTAHSIVGGVLGAGIGNADWSVLGKIAAALVITVPATTVLSALVFFTLRGMLIP